MSAVVKLEKLGRCVIIVHGLQEDVGLETWNQAIATLQGWQGAFDVALVDTADSALTPVQRQQARQVLNCPTWVLADQRATRVMVTALGWMGMRLHAHKRCDAALALTEAGLSAAKHDAVLASLAQLRQVLGHTESKVA